MFLKIELARITRCTEWCTSGQGLPERGQVIRGLAHRTLQTQHVWQRHDFALLVAQLHRAAVFAPRTCSRARLQRVAQHRSEGLIGVRVVRGDVERVLVDLAVTRAVVLTRETVRVAAQRGAEQLIDNRRRAGRGHGQTTLRASRRAASGIYSEIRRRAGDCCRVRVGAGGGARARGAIFSGK